MKLIIIINKALRMEFNTSKEGLSSFFKPYQLESLKYLMTVPSAGSGEVWKYLNTLPNEKVHMSRASIIFFLNKMVEDEICSWADKTGKGGYRKKYSTIPNNMNELRNLLVEKIEAFIERELQPKKAGKLDFILKPLEKIFE